MSETHHRHRTLQSIVAVSAGLLAIVIPSIVTDIVMYATGAFPAPGQPMPDLMWVIPTTYRIVYGIMGCYLAARLAPARPILHAMMLGVIGLTLALAGAVVAWNADPPLGPHWYSVAIIAIALPCAWVGGTLDSLRRASHAT